MVQSQRLQQLIVWRNSLDEELKTYKLTTVSQGTKTAYFAIKSLQEVGRDSRTSHKSLHVVFMYNFLSSSNTASCIFKRVF